MPENPTQRGRRTRRDPYRRATLAPRLTPAPALCPIGQCEHAALSHGTMPGAGSPPEERIYCMAPECPCEEET